MSRSMLTFALCFAMGKKPMSGRHSQNASLDLVVTSLLGPYFGNGLDVGYCPDVDEPQLS
jgi:hypothetical protein